MGSPDSSTTAFCYSPTQTMRSIISDNSLLLMALSRFGIPLGFGDKTVEQVCMDQGIDCSTFLTVADYISGHAYSPDDIDLEQLMAYLKRLTATSSTSSCQ